MAMEFKELVLTVKVDSAGNIVELHEAYCGQDSVDADVRKGPLGRNLSVGTDPEDDVDPADSLTSIIAARKTEIESNDL